MPAYSARARPKTPATPMTPRPTNVFEPELGISVVVGAEVVPLPVVSVFVGTLSVPVGAAVVGISVKVAKSPIWLVIDA